MKQIFLIIFSLVFLSSCGQSAFTSFNEPNQNYQNIKNAQKVQIVDNLLIKAIFSANYLSQKSNKKEVFLLGIYITDDFSQKSKQALNNPFYSLDLNGDTSYKKTLLDKNSVLLKQASFKDRWSVYYLVEFAKKQDKILQLNLTNKEINKKASIKFDKTDYK